MSPENTEVTITMSRPSGGEPRVRDLMSTELITMSPDDSLKDLAKLFDWKAIRHVPIADESGRLVGLVTQRDYLTVAISKFAQLNKAAVEAVYSQIKIRDFMGRKVTAISPETPLREAAQIMLEHKYGCLPVVSDDKLVGIITEADFTRAFAG